jgi:hypothetical protein
METADAAEAVRAKYRAYYASRKGDAAWMEARRARCREANRRHYDLDREAILMRARLARATKHAEAAIARLASLRASGAGPPCTHLCATEQGT